MHTARRTFSAVLASAILIAGSAYAQNKALLLYDDDDNVFVGCLNCNEYSSSSICNQYGTYGSEYNSISIWNEYGTYGSEYNSKSPWNEHGKGLAIVDSDGGFYGRFTASYNNPSRLELPRAIMKFYDKNDDLDELRDALCD